MLRKALLFVLCILVCSAVLYVSIISQERRSTVLKETQGDGIESGVVIAFGNIVEPPYLITPVDGKILINGIIFSPREQDPSIQRENIQVSEAQMRRYELFQSIPIKYLEIYKREGKVKANEEILTFLKDNPLIEEIGFKEEYLVIQFTDSHIEWIDMDSYIKNDSGFYPNSDEKAASRLKQIPNLRSYLEAGNVIAFGYQYTIKTDFINFSKAQTIIKKVKVGSYADENAREEIIELMGPQGREFFADAKREIASW